MSWPEISLGEIAEFRNGLNYTKDNEGRGVSVINVKDFGTKNIPDYDSLGELNPLGILRNQALLQHGDIVFVRSNGNKDLVGRSLFVKHPPENVSFSAFCIRARIPETANPEFYAFFFRTPHFRKRLALLGKGTNISNLNQQVLTNIKVPNPSRTIKANIVAAIKSYDDLIENNRRRIQLLEQAARLLYKEWFVHLRFPGHEHNQIIDGVPEGWEKKPLGELLTLQRGFDLPVSNRKEGHFPIYASTGINGYHAEAKVKGPGVVTGRSGSLGTVMYVSGDFWPLNTTLWVKEFKLVGPHYANHLLANMQLEQYNGGAAVPTLNRNDVHRVEVLSPPSMLLRMFEDQSHDIVKQIEALTSMNLKLAAARDLLLPKLMNGEVAV